MEFKRRTLKQIAELICGNSVSEMDHFVYRTSSSLTGFFEDIETDYAHDGSTRAAWVAETLEQILREPQPAANTPPETFSRVIARLMDQDDALHEGPDRTYALGLLNAALRREGFEAFYAEDNLCYLRSSPVAWCFAVSA